MRTDPRLTAAEVGVALRGPRLAAPFPTPHHVRKAVLQSSALPIWTPHLDSLPHGFRSPPSQKSHFWVTAVASGSIWARREDQGSEGALGRTWGRRDSAAMCDLTCPRSQRCPWPRNWCSCCRLGVGAIRPRTHVCCLQGSSEGAGSTSTAFQSPVLSLDSDELCLAATRGVAESSHPVCPLY